MDCDRSGTLAILVVGVIPNLSNRDRGGLWRIRVGDGEIPSSIFCNFSCIQRWHFFFHRIDNLLSCLIFSQTCELGCPTSCNCQATLINLGLLTIDFFVECNVNTQWTLAILVVGIFPSLGNSKINQLWCVFISNCTGILIDDRSLIATDLSLRNSVGNQLTCGIEYWQLRYLTSPTRGCCRTSHCQGFIR